MMIAWPESLKKEIARRRAVFFIGSGVSASASDSDGERLPTWKEFLEGCLNLLPEGEQKEHVNQLLEKDKFLTALQGIYDNADRADYRNHLKECFTKNNLTNLPIHEVLFDLDLRITITTNFDQIYENYCTQYGEDGYTVLDYTDPDLGDSIRSDERVIIKAHGCIRAPNSIIFTRAQYHKARKEHAGFYEILKAIFLTNTCIFIGCGMEDPDILLALEDVKITSSHEKPHYFIALKDSINPIYKDELFQTYNIKSLEYSPTHDELAKTLTELKDEVIALRENNV